MMNGTFEKKELMELTTGELSGDLYA